MKLEEIQQRIIELSPDELVLFRKWFEEFDSKFRKSKTSSPTAEERLKNLKGSLKGKGLLKALMDDKKRERDS